MWLRCYGVPCHAWYIPFFEFLSSMVGKYICCEESTCDQSRMDVASVMVRTNIGMLINESFNVNINNVLFRIRMVEDTQGLSRVARHLDEDKGQGSHMSSSNDDEGLLVWNENDNNKVDKGDCDNVGF